jgi:hypothetical protein
MEKIKNISDISVGNLKEIHNFVDLELGGRIILGW